MVFKTMRWKMDEKSDAKRRSREGENRRIGTNKGNVRKKGVKDGAVKGQTKGQKPESLRVVWFTSPTLLPTRGK